MESDSDSEPLAVSRNYKRRSIQSSSDEEEHSMPSNSVDPQTSSRDSDFAVVATRPARETPGRRKMMENFEEYRRKRNSKGRIEDPFQQNYQNMPPFQVQTNIFKSIHPGNCRLASCKKLFKCNESEIIGVWLLNKNTQQYIESDSDSGFFYICAEHQYDQYDAEGAQQRTEDCEDDVPTQEDKDFIDDMEETADNEGKVREMLHEETQRLGKQTMKDLINEERYLNEHSKYQLQSHTTTNPNIDPDGRFFKNMRDANLDIGLQQEIGRNIQNDYCPIQTIYVGGQQVDVVLGSRTVSLSSSKCALQGCEERFFPGISFTMKAYIRNQDNMIHSLICCSHLQEYQNQK